MDQESPKSESRLSRIVIAVLYAAAFGIPIVGGALIVVAGVAGARMSRISSSRKYVDLAKHGWIAGLGGLAFWTLLYVGEDWMKARRLQEQLKLPPVSLALDSACSTPLERGRSAKVQGWLVIPTYAKDPNPCPAVSTCKLALVGVPPSATEQSPKSPAEPTAGSLPRPVHIELPAGSGPGQLYFNGAQYIPRADDGSPVGSRMVTVIGGRGNDFKGDGCTFQVDKISAEADR